MKWWHKIFRFFRFGRNAESEKSSDSETFDGVIVGPEGQEARSEVGKMLQLRSGPPNGDGDKYERYRGTPLMQAIAPSGIWVVIKFSDALAAGGVADDFRQARIVRERTGERAIQAVYTADLEKHGQRANLGSAKGEDGRYVALDFYTGHRVEALVRGGWQAELELA